MTRRFLSRTPANLSQAEDKPRPGRQSLALAFAEREQGPGSAACPCRITREAQFLSLHGQQVIDYRAFRRVLLHEVEDAADIIIVFIVRDLWHV